jgi:2-amino-4-hydroxy-6-hydroxymethyldihydropteridine diphosphokinase
MATLNLVLGLGSNLDDRKANLKKAMELLEKKFTHVESSRIYESKAVDVVDQPDFYNKVAHFSVSDKYSPVQLMSACHIIEAEMGRVKNLEKGPRIIDIDVLFLDEQIIQTPNVQIPHPRWKERSFVVRPLMELAIWKKLRRNFPIPSKIEFQIDAFPLK